MTARSLEPKCRANTRFAPYKTLFQPVVLVITQTNSVKKSTSLALLSSRSALAAHQQFFEFALCQLAPLAQLQISQLQRPDPAALQTLDPQAELEKLQHAVATDPANDDARFEYVKRLLQDGQVPQARTAFAPVANKTGLVRRLYALERWLNAIEFIAARADSERVVAVFDSKIALNKRDFETRYDKARLLIAAQQWTDAMDELLEILMRDKAWNEDLARKTYVAVLDLIEPAKPKVADGQIPPDDPVVATYRRRLSSVVLS